MMRFFGGPNRGSGYAAFDVLPVRCSWGAGISFPFRRVDEKSGALNSRDTDVFAEQTSNTEYIHDHCR